MATARCFVALVPPAEVVDQLAGLRDPTLDGVRWSRPEQLHVTLRFLGDVDPLAAVAAVGGVRHGPVEVGLGPEVVRMFDTVLALPVRGVDGLAAAVRTCTAELVPDDGRGFVGHLTLARIRQRRPVIPSIPVSLSWVADQVVVVESRRVEGRHEHTVLGGVTLRT